MAVLLAGGGAYALASINWCRVPTPEAAKIISTVSAEGPLSAGAAQVVLQPDFPVTVAGYGPFRPTASRAEISLQARALVVQAGKARVGWVTLDTLLVTDEMTRAIRDDAKLDGVWVSATHTHSSMGGYDPRPMAQLAGTGVYRHRDRDAWVTASVQALRLAAKSLRPATVSSGQASLEGHVAARSGDHVDTSFRVTRFQDDNGPIAQLVALSAHPTLVPRDHGLLNPDYPGLFATAQASSAGITLVLQSAGGNAKVVGGSTTPQAFADVLNGLMKAITFSAPVSNVSLKASTVSFVLPRPDATRLVGAFFRMPAENFMCLSSSFQGEVQALRLGELMWWSAPFELSAASAQTLGASAPSAAGISLTNGYFGYLEPEAAVSAKSGESNRQYFAPSLSVTVTEAVSTALRAVQP